MSFFVNTLFALIAISIIPLSAVEIASGYPHYSIKLRIDPASRFIEVEGNMKIPRISLTTDTLGFYLHKQLSIHSLSIDNRDIPILGSENSDIRYMPEARKVYLLLNKDNPESEFISFGFSYSGKITEQPEWLANTISTDWVELGEYYPWFPWCSNLAMFTYSISIDLDTSYTVFAAGKQSSEDNWRVFNNIFPTSDIVICASRELKIRASRINNSELKIASNSLDEVTIDSLIYDISRIYKYFNNVFGDKEDDLVLVESKRKKGGGYSRPGGLYLTGFTDAGYFQNRTGYYRYLAHEISHAWWRLADSNTWHDWLNESFAEFSAFMFIGHTSGADAFHKRINKCREDSEGIAVIWELNRNSEEAYKVLYQKGPALLGMLYERIEEEQFIKLCREVLGKKVNNTYTFLDVLSKISGEENALWFETLLKN